VGSSSQLAGVFVATLVDGLTLIRTRGDFLCYLRSAGAVGNGFHGAFGIAKATFPAISAGVASIPTPIMEEDWDGWLFHKYFTILAPGPIAVATAAQEALQGATAQALRFEVDSKAMRKSDVNEAFYAVVEVIEIGVADMDWAFNSRMLFKDMS